ncbi:MAG: RDD family protein [Candidatus Kapabacteria bacterium]|nr:RDD family protein [Candidatus Kapabacteria bacterium]
MENIQKVDFSARLLSAFLDFLIYGFIIALCSSPRILCSINNDFDYQTVKDFRHSVDYITLIQLFGFTLFLTKDVFNGRSIGKRITGLCVVDNITNELSNPFFYIVRNIIVFNIFDFAFLRRDPSRRMGDIWGGTKVIPYNPDTHTTSITPVKILLSIITCYILISMLYLLDKL